MYTIWLVINYAIALVGAFLLIRNLFTTLKGKRIFLNIIIMVVLYVLAMIIAFDASKFAHMADLYPNEYAEAGLSQMPIILRDIVAISFIIVAQYVKKTIDKRIDEEVKENQKKESTKMWKNFFND
ncbi:hypothetical protein R9X47_00275 [Wukongibacter baidiensis]|uniref:hypothetical protein n=1 Tax=Wukongibacter baidiensis TaxID=1723361 RepID=UPI003D7F4990